MKTLSDVWARNERYAANTLAVVYKDRKLTYSELVDRGRRLANAVWHLGARSQDRIGILAMNCSEFFEVYAACQMGGYVASTVNFRLAPEEMLYILRDSAPHILIFEKEYASVIESIRGELSEIEHFVCIGDSLPWAQNYDELLRNATPQIMTPSPKPSDVAHLIYTSGTTGKPKGVMRTHAAELKRAETMAAGMDIRVNGRCIVTMPLFHVGALSNIMSQQLYSGTLYVHRSFEPEQILKEVQEHKIMVLHMVPTMIQMLLERTDIESYDLSSLETIQYAAAPMPVELLQRGLQRLGPVFLNGYGMTETNACSLTKSQHRPTGSPQEVKRLGSVGQPMPHVDLRIVDKNDEDVPLGMPGEILLRTDVMFSGYWNNSVASVEALRGGWYHTGDIAYQDEDGFVFLVDRKKDMIISGGENIYCQEIEQALMLHGSLMDAAVIGLPHEVWGEQVKAVVVRRKGVDVTEQELVDFCLSRIARYKRPRSIDFVDELPRLASGKVNKKILREKYKGGE